MLVATIQLLCLCLGTAQGQKLQSKIVVVYPAAMGASVEVHLSNFVVFASCRREEQLGVVCCTFRIAFDCDNRGWYVRDADIRSKDVGSYKTLCGHLMREM